MPSAVDAADTMVALHATDPATIFLSAHARTSDLDVASLERELFDERSLMRTLAMRRTLFVASREVLPLIEVSSSIDVARTERNRLEKYVAESGIEDPPAWLAARFAEVLEGLDGQSLSAREITTVVPQLTTKLFMGGGKFGRAVGATSRVLGLMAVEGLLARGRPSSSWTGRQYVWHRRDQWLPLDDPLPSPEDAASSLIQRWLWCFGPGTLTDLCWWTGWTKGKTRAALSALEVVEVELDHGGLGYVLADDTDEVEAPDDWLRLLPSLDPTSMGWKERDWYVGSNTAELFDRNGNIGPTIWANGDIVGGWSQTGSGAIATKLFTKLPRSQTTMLDHEIDRVKLFLGEAHVRPSFPTPLQKELSGRS